jgi:hypothetical protein
MKPTTKQDLITLLRVMTPSFIALTIGLNLMGAGIIEAVSVSSAIILCGGAFLWLIRPLFPNEPAKDITKEEKK